MPGCGKPWRKWDPFCNIPNIERGGTGLTCTSGAYMSGCMKTMLEPEIKLFFLCREPFAACFIYLSIFYVIYGDEPFSLVCAVAPRRCRPISVL